MFRVQDLVPEIYPDKSRDFQMFCRAYDVAFNGVKNSIDSISQITDTLRCRDRLLELLKTKLGLFTSFPVSDEDLRLVLHAFPHIIRYKGSQRAIDYIVCLYSRLVAYHQSSCYINMTPNKEGSVIEITSDYPIIKTDLLIQLIKLVVPTGYTVTYYVTETVDINQSFRTVSEISYNTSTSDIDTSHAGRFLTAIAIKKDPNSELTDKYRIDHAVNLTEITPEKEGNENE